MSPLSLITLCSSNNPFANGYEMYLHQNGNGDKSRGQEQEEYTPYKRIDKLTSFSPNVALINKDCHYWQAWTNDTALVQ